jgi:hypothetical protein
LKAAGVTVDQAVMGKLAAVPDEVSTRLDQR